MILPDDDYAALMAHAVAMNDQHLRAMLDRLRGVVPPHVECAPCLQASVSLCTPRRVPLRVVAGTMRATA